MDSVKVISFAKKSDKEDSVLWTETVMVDFKEEENSDQDCGEDQIDAEDQFHEDADYDLEEDKEGEGDEDVNVDDDDKDIDVGGGYEDEKDVDEDSVDNNVFDDDKYFEDDEDFDYKPKKKKKKASRKAKTVRFATARNVKRAPKIQPCKIQLNGIYCKGKTVLKVDDS